ncbi:MAG: hypothetical protein MI724_07855 [Spirochaetales bacterium]|nr:hypothetical protein [Spirochaetales bacterium]
MDEITFPIFIAEPWDVELFDDIEEAEVSLEAIDVRNGIYEGYDATGRILSITATYTDKIVVSLAKPVSFNKDRLIELLLHTLDFVDYRVLPEERGELDLVVRKYLEFHKQTKWRQQRRSFAGRMKRLFGRAH